MFCQTQNRDSQNLIPMTHAPETHAINRLHFLATVFGASFVDHASGMKISGAENIHIAVILGSV